MTILVISNPISGDGQGSKFVQEQVLPLLQNANLNYRLEETKAPEEAGRLATDFLRNHESDTDATIVVSGGDGTIHEVVNGIGLYPPPGNSFPDAPPVVRLVVCPQGTANALYSSLFPQSDGEVSSPKYHLKSLRAFLEGRSRPLVLTKTQLLAGDGVVLKTLLGVVVTSTALHATILKAAEHLRSSVPGIDRFKLAAAQNISTWYHSRVRLHSSNPGGGNVKIYNPQLKAFKPLPAAIKAEDDFTGPFQYFLSTVNVDRLEPDFEISPLFLRLPPGPGEMDLVIIRPLRDPSVQSETSESRENFVKNASAALRAAYNHGAHITMSYTQEGTVTHSEGPSIVEYIRCGGWEWEPAESDAAAHIVCVDGAILTIGKGGKATCQVITDTRNARFTICA